MKLCFQITLDDSVAASLRAWEHQQPFRQMLFAYFYRAFLFAAIAGVPVVVFSSNGLLYGALTFVFVVAVHRIAEIEETIEAINFIRKDYGITAVLKRALAAGEQTSRFIALANFYKESSQKVLDA